jgi:hypothetical protein
MNLDDLQKICRCATPGPWTHNKDDRRIEVASALKRTSTRPTVSQSVDDCLAALEPDDAAAKES